MSEYDGEERTRRARHGSLATYARLVRVPNLFTAPPDVVLGASIAAGLGYAVSLRTVAGLALASILLYAAGTTLNDYFDAAEDARERPERPIPAGEVSPRRALGLGLVLLGGGIAVALAAGGAAAGGIAAILALLIVLYDGVAKGSTVGFLFMGGTRGANVLLGVSAAVVPISLSGWALLVPAAVVLYVAGVTFMAESESGTSDPLAVPVAAAAAAIAAVGVVTVLAVRSPAAVDAAVSIAFLVGFVAWTGRALRAAHVDPSPETIGPAVGTCVLALPVLNAAFAGTTGAAWAVGTAAFLLPAVGLARVFDVS